MKLTCLQCQNEFAPKRDHGKYCSNTCQKKHQYLLWKEKNSNSGKIRKPVQNHTYDLKNEQGGVHVNKKDRSIAFTFCKMDDQTNYYRGNGVFGYSYSEVKDMADNPD